MKATIHILTETYPYGEGETFIANELEYLSDYFNIICYPQLINGESRTLPKNTSVNTVLANISMFDYSINILKNLFYLKYLPLFFRRNSPNFFRSFVNFYGYCIYGFTYATQLHKIDFAENDVLYSYWFKYTALAISLHKSKALKITKAHRTDIYEMDYSLPFHKVASKNLDLIYSISDDGLLYLRDSLQIDKAKLRVSKLGTFLQEDVDQIVSSDISLVSCSTLIPRKRVDGIYRAIIELARNNPFEKIHWTHIGSGGGDHNLFYNAAELPQNCTIDFIGYKSNAEVHKIYASKKFDCFINYSTSEGIPVSIMEALSYNIPAIAVNTGGNREIISDETGYLLEEKASVSDLAFAVQKVAIENKNKYNTVEFWINNYSAVKNYEKFKDEIFNNLKIIDAA